jgi:hypothetical protein
MRTRAYTVSKDGKQTSLEFKVESVWNLCNQMTMFFCWLSMTYIIYDTSRLLRFA